MVVVLNQKMMIGKTKKSLAITRGSFLTTKNNYL